MGESVANLFRRGRKVAQASAVFTNRVNELAAFDAAVEQHRARLAEVDALDPDVPRNNVLNFFGVGGIGKSSLLRVLEARLEITAPKVAHVLFDFQRPSTFNVEDMLLRLRAAIGELGIRCVAFDFGVAFYWSVVHPGESIDSYLRRNTALHRAAEKLGLSDQIESSVTEVVSSVLSVSSAAHGAARLGQAVTRLITDRRRIRHVIAECEALEAFLDPSTIEQNVSYLPALLAWDLAQANDATAVVFWDTYEEVTERGRQIERIFQRICFLLPNILFVIAGRNELDWSESRLHGALDYVGPGAWPGLVHVRGVSTAARLVGDFSAEDADRYLRDRLVVNGAPVIPYEARRRIAAASGGWPLYLDTAVGYYQQALAEGRAGADYFSGAFPALVSRLAADLNSEERRVLRGCALFKAFDPELARAASGAVSEAAVRSLLARNFVKFDASATWPYSLHPALINAVRADVEGREAWTSRDWSEAAGRVLDLLGRRFASTGGAHELGLFVNLGLRLAHEYDQFRPWLSDACRRLSTLGGLAGVPDLGSSDTQASALAHLAVTLTRVRTLPFRDAADALAGCLTTALSSTDAAWARARRASAQLSAGLLDGAEREYRLVLDQPDVAGDIRAEAATMFALLLLKRGSFRELAQHVESSGNPVDADRLMGDLHRYHAEWDEARARYSAGLQRARANNDVGLSRLFETELELVEGWTGELVSKPDTRVSELGGRDWTDINMLVAQALQLAGTDTIAAIELLDAAEAMTTAFGFAECSADVIVARAFIAAVAEDSAAVGDALARLRRYATDTGTFASWVQVVHRWAGVVGAPDAGPVHWVGSSGVPKSWDETLARRKKSAAPA